MATGKKTGGKKSAKTTAPTSDDVPVNEKKEKKERVKREKKAKKEKVPYTSNADRITSFIGCMIHVGYIGESIPEDSKERKVAAQAMRQMAQQLDRQVHKSTT